MGDALPEFLADIIEVARKIGTILQAVRNGRPGV
jgi:hypothetical protein